MMGEISIHSWSNKFCSSVEIPLKKLQRIGASGSLQFDYIEIVTVQNKCFKDG